MMNKTKITVKIYAPLLAAFEKKIDSIFIKRDAFLNHVIKAELSYISSELSGLQLSSSARRYISGELGRMDTKLINVVVDKNTASELKKIVKNTNIVRDALFNRLFMFLLSREHLLEYLDLPVEIEPSSFLNNLENIPTSPIGAVESIFADPLHYLRVAASERFDTGLYLLTLPHKLVGFSCFIEDREIPGNHEYDREEELLISLQEFENESFSSENKNGVGKC